MKRLAKLLMVVVGAIALLGLAACGDSNSSPKPATPGAGTGVDKTQGGKKRMAIGFCMTLDDPYWNNMQLGSVDEGRKLGADVTIMNASEDAGKEIQQIKELIAKGVDLLCIVPMKPQELVPGVKEANRKGVPVIIVNRAIGEGCEYLCYVGTDTYNGGVTSADILMKAIGTEGEIVEFHQVLGSGPQQMRTQALADVMKKHLKVQRVGFVSHQGDRAVAAREMQTILSKPDSARIKGVYVHGDPQAIAIARACQEKGRKDIAVVGMGGSQEAIDAIKEGVLTGTSYQQPEEEGRLAVRLAMKYLKGQKLDKQYLIPCPAITKDNAAQFKGQF
jgi:ribose transport system substrate-binding protein